MTRPRRTLAERKAARQKIREGAIKRAEHLGMTLRCQTLADDMDHPNHALCRGEEPGNAGCLCRCHDAQAVP
jgi:hypothetical protein